MTQALSTVNPGQELTTEQLKHETGVRPNVDIYKSQEGYTFYIDLPGVPEGNVSIEVDEDNVLSLFAKTEFEPVGDVRVQQFALDNYSRSFRLGKEINKDKILTEFGQGVLKIFVPLREELKPKKITIQA